MTDTKKDREFKGPRRTDENGETIITSAGYEDLDPASLVEPTELPPEEQEEEQLKLSAKVKLKFLFTQPAASIDDWQVYEGELLRTIHQGDTQTISLKLGIEQSIELLNYYTYTPGNKLCEIYYNYVFNEDTGTLKKWMENKTAWTFVGMEIGELDRSLCVVTVKLDRLI